MTLQIGYSEPNVLRDSHFALDRRAGVVRRAILLEGRHHTATPGSTDHVSDGNAKLTAQAVTGPDGVAGSATRFTGVDGQFNPNVNKSVSLPTTAGEPCTHMFVLRPDTHHRFLTTLQLSNAFARNRWVDLDSGTIETNGSPNAQDDTQVSILPFIDYGVQSSDAAGYYCVMAVGTPTVSGANARCALQVANPALGQFGTYFSNGTEQFTLYAAQYEQSFGFATSIVPRLDSDNVNDGPYKLSVGPDNYLTSLPGSLAAPQAMTTLVDYADRGAHAGGRPGGVFQVGDAGGAAPRLYVVQTATGFDLVHEQGGSSVVSTVAVVPTRDDFVRVRAALADNGSVQLGVTINDGAEQLGAASAGLALPAQWSSRELSVNSLGLEQHGFMALFRAEVLAGVQTVEAFGEQ